METAWLMSCWPAREGKGENEKKEETRSAHCQKEGREGEGRTANVGGVSDVAVDGGTLTLVEGSGMDGRSAESEDGERSRAKHGGEEGEVWEGRRGGEWWEC
jgi:hypothetical protein